MVYHPRPYDESFAYAFPADGVEINYTVATAKYCAYYIPVAHHCRNGSGSRLWQGSLALDWTTILREHPITATRFLLIDYPGYGRMAVTRRSRARVRRWMPRLGAD